MKLFKPIAVLLLVAATIFSCKKDNTQPANVNVKLTSSDNGKSASVKQGQTISITLGNPGDGGYTFNNWQYDNSVLKLDSHSHINPANANVMGDFGSDVWVFTALKSGKSSLSITISRGSADTIAEFVNTIQVQ